MFRIFNRSRRIAHRPAKATVPPQTSPLIENLEHRNLMSGGGFHQLTAQALLNPYFNNLAAVSQTRGAYATANDFGHAGMNFLSNTINRGGLGYEGQMHSLQAHNYVMNSPLATAGLRRDPVTGFNPVTDIGPGFTYPVYKAVTNDIARNLQNPVNGQINYTGVMDRYGLVNVPGAGYAGQNAYFNLGVAQNGASFLARHPNGQQAYPSHFGLPYSNQGVFTGGGINYNNVYNNPWNRWG